MNKEESADAIYTWLQEYEAPRLELVIELLESHGWRYEGSTSLDVFMEELGLTEEDVRRYNES